LIGQERFDLVEALITRVNEEGQVSEGMLTDLGMINLASREFERGLDRLILSEGGTTNPFYIGLAKLQMDDNQGAIRNLVEMVAVRWRGSRGPSWRPGGFMSSYRIPPLDEYGFPDVAVVNRILINKENYGESREMLEEKWEEWVYRLPFDAPVAEALAKLYERRLKKLDKNKDAAVYQRLERKLKLVRNRAARYNINSFSQGTQY